MNDFDMLKNLEISGFMCSILIICYGVYKLIIIKGVNSKCGALQIDLRSKSTRQKEMSLQQEVDLAKLDLEKMKATLELEKLKIASMV